MKNILLLLLLLLSANGMSQLKTGLLLNGGSGNVRGVVPKMNNLDVDNILNKGGCLSVKDKWSLGLGYRFRLASPQQEKIFYDLDLLLGIKAMDFQKYQKGEGISMSSSGTDLYFSTSVAASLNFVLIKGLYVGAGVEPSCFYLSPPKAVFDIPVFAKIGYNVNDKIEFAFTYKVGLLNTIKTKEVKTGYISDWNLSVFIPFTFR